MAETLAPGANVSAIARREAIVPSQLFGWRRQAIRNGAVAPADAAEEPRLRYAHVGREELKEAAAGAAKRRATAIEKAHKAGELGAMKGGV